MPAKLTVEYDLTGLSGANLYAKVRAALIESGAEVYDEYSNSTSFYLVERVALSGQAVGYLRWSVTGDALGSAILFRTWSVTSHNGTALTGSLAVSNGASPAYLRVCAGAGYRFLQVTNAAGASGSTCMGWVAPTGTPPGWDLTVSPFIVGIGTSSGLFSVYTGPQNSALARQNLFVTQLPQIDPALMGAIGRYPLFLGPGHGLHGWPEDLQVISGRTTGDFSSLRDSEYTIMVGAETRTYRPLCITSGNAYVLRTS